MNVDIILIDIFSKQTLFIGSGIGSWISQVFFLQKA